MADLKDIGPALPLLDAMQAGVTLMDGELEIIWANRFFRREIETLPGLCGKHCFVGQVPAERRCEDCLPPQVQRSRTTGETVRSVHRPDGSVLYFRVVVTPLDEDASLLATFILPLRSDDHERGASWRERFLLSAMRNSRDGVFALDRTQTVRFWNRGAEQIFGWSIAEMVGQPVHRIFSEEDWKNAEEVFSPADPLAPLDYRELQVGTRNRGVIWVELSRTPLLDGSGRPNGHSFVMRDITERKRSLEQMAFTERMTAVGNMSAALAHEIGTPLGVISTNAEFLMLDMEEGDSRREDLEAIVHEADRIGGLVRDLLRFSRPEVAELEPLQVTDVLRQVERLLHHQSSKQNTEVLLQTDGDLPLVLGDSHQIEQVTLNLAINALQAVESGGEVFINAAEGVHSGADGERHPGVVVMVRDTGPGLPEGVGGRIFDPFFTTKPNGTGLGLSVCKSIIDEHGGTLTAHDHPAGGACFTVWLPALLDDS